LRGVILRDELHGRDLVPSAERARLGRDPDLEFPCDPDDDVVSAFHALVRRDADGAWWLEDAGSTNGTWLNGRRVGSPERLRTGDRFTLGQRGPAFTARIPGDLGRTRQEAAVDPAEPLLRLRRVGGGKDLLAQGREIVIGRAAACTIPLRTIADAIVSKRHAVVAIAADGSATVGDLGSKNGTFVNGRQIDGTVPLAVGDRLMLGWQGPLLEVRAIGPTAMEEGQGAAFQPEKQPPKTFGGMVQEARSSAGEVRGTGAHLFVQSLARQMAHESTPAFRMAVVGGMLVLAAAVVIAYRSVSRRAAESEARLASTEQALATQLRSENTARRQAEEEIARLRRDLAAARASSVSRAVLDSLATRLRSAEARVAAATTGAPAVDFSRVAVDNQDAVGLVVVRFGTDSVMGTGFVITPSGYMLTSRHVVQPPDHAGSRAIDVVMADTRTPLGAEVVSVSSAADQDVAVLRIRNYRGPAVRRIDWQGTGVSQGAPAALIGFPRGSEIAFDSTGYVRTTMFAGIIAKATAQSIQFGGITVRGSSGSPIFNSEGQVIAIHFGGLSDGPVLGFAVPMNRVRRWLPAPARAELQL
jgi:pSer/pThr/pTyr-binding forkhead associated (FHA) protein/S1-C subfamily serine protease